MIKGKLPNEKKIKTLSLVFITCIVLLTTLILLIIFSDSQAVSPNISKEVSYLISLLMLVGMGILYFQVMPLMGQAVRAEQDLLITNKRLQESENRFRLAFDHSAIGVALVSIEGQFFKVNQSLCQILDYDEKDLLDLDLKSIIYFEDFQKDLPFIRDMLEGKIGLFQNEQRLYDKMKQIIWVTMSATLVRDDFNQPLYFIMQFQNITSEKKAKDQLQKMAYHDPLTGLANRNKLEEQIKNILANAQRRQLKFVLILLDLDHFKNINDTIGHDAGDCLLQIVAERLKNTVRETDLITRLGGDEFVLVITDISKIDEVIVVAQKILANLLQPIIIKNHEFYVTTSIGISVYPDDGGDMQVLLKNADLALYRAKEAGRNNYQFCTAEMTANVHKKMAKQQALNQALLREEFIIYYQPKMDLAHQRINGVEALLRWQSLDYGFVSPDEIISLAEETGIIVPLSNWILKTACQQMKEWQDAGFTPLTLSINLSPKQFKQPDFVKNTLKILTDCNFLPEFLEFEITENLILHNPEKTLETLKEIKQFNIQIAIDDFGTGYSSLSYLKSFEVDKIKIDKSLIQRIANDGVGRAIVSALIVMANKLGIKTIAEGVETDLQYEFLAREKCTEIQGYFITPPLTVEAMQKFLRESAKKPHATVEE